MTTTECIYDYQYNPTAKMWWVMYFCRCGRFGRTQPKWPQIIEENLRYILAKLSTFKAEVTIPDCSLVFKVIICNICR